MNLFERLKEFFVKFLLTDSPSYLERKNLRPEGIPVPRPSKFTIIETGGVIHSWEGDLADNAFQTYASLCRYGTECILFAGTVDEAIKIIYKDAIDKVIYEPGGETE